MAPPQQGLPCLTASRFIAAFLVILFHFGQLVPLPWTLFNFGRQAVSFFFILSGVVLTYTYCDRITGGRIGWAAFLNLRFARIIPLHIATWLLATMLHFWFGWRPDQGPHPFGSWIAGLFCVQVYWPSLDALFKWNGQSWSICCELFFYALFPVLLPLLARRLKSLSSMVTSMSVVFLGQVALYVSVSFLLRHYMNSGHTWLGYRTFSQLPTTALLVIPPLRLGEFVVGMCLGLLILRRGSIVRSRTQANTLLLFCIAALIALVHVKWDRLNPIIAGTQDYVAFVPVLTMIIAVLASGLTVVTPLLENAYALLLGEASYSLYLIHGFVIPLPLGPHPSAVRYFLCVAACIAGSAALYLLLERPARMAWRRRTENRLHRIEPQRIIPGLNLQHS